ncbi:MAG: translation elongation factor-like protein [Nitrososphaeria archaeon]|jgi:translation elongation factor EF-1alpha
MSEVKKTVVGEIEHFYPKINVVIVTVKTPLKVGDKIIIEGKTTHFEQIVDSMQIEHSNIKEAELGQSIGLKVVNKVKEGDTVFKLD